MKRFGMKKFMLVLGCMMLSGMCACNKSMDLNEYVEVEFEGYGGYGKARIVFDEERFEEDYGKTKFRGPDADAYNHFYESVTDCILSEFIEFEIDEGGDLSNGDKVKVKWDCDAGKIKSLTGYTAVYENVVVEVEGLEEVPLFDAFEGLEVIFDGASGVGTAVVCTENVVEGSAKLKFELDKYSYLLNGDVVTVSIVLEQEENSEEWFLENCGGVPKVLQKQYTVEGLSDFAKALSQISESSMKEMDDYVRQSMEEHVELDWSDKEKLDEMELLGNYFLTPKEEDGMVYNVLFFVYKIRVVNTEYPEGMDYYHYTYFANLLVDEEGNVGDYQERVGTPYGGYDYYYGTYTEVVATEQFWYWGYEDLESFYEAYIEYNLEDFNCESTVKEEIFMNYKEKTVDIGGFL